MLVHLQIPSPFLFVCLFFVYWLLPCSSSSTEAQTHSRHLLTRTHFQTRRQVLVQTHLQTNNIHSSGASSSIVFPLMSYYLVRGYVSCKSLFHFPNLFFFISRPACGATIWHSDSLICSQLQCCQAPVNVVC